MVFCQFNDRKVCIEINNESVYFNDCFVETKREDRINTLISLFSFRKKWKSEDVDLPKYELYFKNNDQKYVYRFNNLPSNWFLFKACIDKLIRV